MLLGKSRLGTCVRIRSLRLADIVDHVDPVMLIVGSRGVGQLKGLVSYFCSPQPDAHLHLNTEFFWAQHHTT